jgi:hypothetical protein
LLHLAQNTSLIITRKALHPFFVLRLQGKTMDNNGLAQRQTISEK